MNSRWGSLKSLSSTSSAPWKRFVANALSSSAYFRLLSAAFSKPSVEIFNYGSE